MTPLVRLIERVQQGASAVELIYTSHARWPLPPHRPLLSSKLRVSVLDSSFNPPTLAHLALARAAPPAPPANPPHDPSGPSAGSAYDANLLLLSVRNADKKLASGDATYVQRLEMMILLAKDIHVSASGHGEDGAAANVAVAIIDEPTFVGKSKALLHFLYRRLASLSPSPPSTAFMRGSADTAPPLATGAEVLSHNARPQLTFLVGMDTLERLFAPRYYGSEEAMLTSLRRFFSVEGDDAWVVCARRVMRGIIPKQEDEFMATIEEFIQSKRVTIIDIGERESSISSTEIRQSLKPDSQWKTLLTPSMAEYISEQNLYIS